MLVGILFLVVVVINYLFRDIKVTVTKPPRATVNDQMIITLMKLEHNVNFDMIESMYMIGQSTAADYFWKIKPPSRK